MPTLVIVRRPRTARSVTQTVRMRFLVGTAGGECVLSVQIDYRGSASRPRGQRVADHAPQGRWESSTFIAALRVTGLTAPGVLDGPMAAHKVDGVRHAIEAVGATLRFLPPYSPDFNPIELCFAKLKAIVRKARCRSIDTLWPLLGECLSRFTPTECRNYVRHCGYTAAKAE